MAERIHPEAFIATSIAERQQVWKRLRPDALASLAASMTDFEISELFGLHPESVAMRLRYHGLVARPAAAKPLSALTHRQINRCPALIHGAPCAAPLEPDDTCRWAHQHTND